MKTVSHWCLRAMASHHILISSNTIYTYAICFGNGPYMGTPRSPETCQFWISEIWAGLTCRSLVGYSPWVSKNQTQLSTLLH